MDLKPKDLKALRVEIDQIDRELVRLLDRRAEIARVVGLSKANSGMSTFDPGRAKAVITRAISQSTGAFPREGLTYVFREVLSACLNLQKPLKVGFLGPKDTFAHQAAIREFGSSVDFNAYEQIREIFAAVENGWIDYGVVPIENSTGGTVHYTLDAFIDHSAQICSEILLPISHSLLADCTLEEVTKVYSHPQAFLQCGIWLKENLPKAEHVEVGSTAQGMLQAKQVPFSAAIGSEIAAEQYGLRILAKGIEDSQDNTTRFLVISKSDSRPCGDDKTSLMFSVKDRPGALYNILKPFNDLGVNLSKLESRPTKRKAWEQAFFVDATGHREDPILRDAIASLREHCEEVRILGSYPREKTPREIEELQRIQHLKAENGQETAQQGNDLGTEMEPIQ